MAEIIKNKEELTVVGGENEEVTAVPDEKAVSIESSETQQVTEGVEEKEDSSLNEADDKEEQTIYELLEKDIMSSDLPLKEKNRRLSKLIRMREKKVNILLVGATGSGKSSTINAMFNMDVAKVGKGVDPETDRITSYNLSNLTIWDTPGLGDSISNDERYNVMLTKKLSETDGDGNLLIDLILVILDASSKDLGTSFDLINNTIIPCLGDDAADRILIGLNQADVAMKGKHWDIEKNEPDDVLIGFLEKKVASVQKRIKEATELDICPIYYCAGYTDDEGNQCKPYNLAKLLYYIIKSIPAEKRLGIANNINQDREKWQHDDGRQAYTEEIKKDFWDSLTDYIAESAADAGIVGERILGIPGKFAGFFIGGLFGLGKGIYHGIVD